jgi:putative phosphoribosyl transferase
VTAAVSKVKKTMESRGTLFRDRKEAGRFLASRLLAYTNRPDVVVLARVPVAYEVATALHAPLDLFLVRKLALPATKSWQWAPLQAVGCEYSIPKSFA